VSVDWLSIVGDAVWIVAMALIASGSRTGWRRIPDDVRVPMQWRLDKTPTWRAAKRVAFGVTLAVPLVFGLILSAAARDVSLGADERLLNFLVRTATAPVFVLIHYAWLRAALKTLASEGALKP